jgi:hypothetical protein
MGVYGFGVLAAVSLALFACGDDDGGGGSGPGGSSGSAGSAGLGGSGAMGGSGGGSGASGSAGQAGGSGLSCQSYCATMQENCKNENAQYPSLESCMAVCATFPAGTETDTQGNTLGCRSYHAGAAQGTTADATLHCPHAGPAGVGLCGSNCEGYCNIMVTTCPGEFSAGTSECLQKCDGLAGKDSTAYTVASTTGDTLQCRLYHASVGAESQQSALMHCPHAGITPTDFCK